MARAEVLLPAIVADIAALLADKAYDAQKRVLSVLDSAGVQAVIPSKANRKVQREYAEEMYKSDT